MTANIVRSFLFINQAFTCSFSSIPQTQHMRFVEGKILGLTANGCQHGVIRIRFYLVFSLSKPMEPSEWDVSADSPQWMENRSLVESQGFLF